MIEIETDIVLQFGGDLITISLIIDSKIHNECFNLDEWQIKAIYNSEGHDIEPCYLHELLAECYYDDIQEQIQLQSTELYKQYKTINQEIVRNEEEYYESRQYWSGR